MFVTSNPKLINSILRCIRVRNSNTNALYEFPLESLLLKFMISAKVIDEYADMAGLQRLYAEYENEGKSNFKIEDLIQEKWIRLELGEWIPAVGLFRDEAIAAIKDDKLRSVIAFLNYLRHKKYSVILRAVIPNADVILQDFYELFPDTPDIKWLTDQHILENRKNEYSFTNGNFVYSNVINKVLAYLWGGRIKESSSQDEKQSWLKLAYSCCTTSNIFKYFSFEARVEVLRFLIEILEGENQLGDCENEQKFFARLLFAEYSLKTHSEANYDEIDKLYNKPYDLIELLNNKAYRNFSPSLYFTRNRLRLLIDCLIEYFDYVPNDYSSKAALILAKLFESGYFAHFEHFYIMRPEALIALSAHAETQFFSVYLLHSMIDDIVETEDACLKAFALFFEEILKGLEYTSYYAEPKKEQISLIVRFLLSECSFYKDNGLSDGVKKKTEIVEKILISLLKKLTIILKNQRLASKTDNIIGEIIKDLGEILQKNGNPHQKARALAGLVLVVQEFYSTIPKDDGFKNILRYLNEFYQFICEGNRNFLDIYISSEYWLHPIWFDVYESAGENDRCNYHKIVSFSDANKESDVNQEDHYNIWHNALNRGIIQTGIIMGIIKEAYFKYSPDSVVFQELTDTLYNCITEYQYNDMYNIFRLSSTMANSRKILTEIGMYISPTHKGWKTYEDSLTLEKAMICIDFIQNADTYKIVSNFIITHADNAKNIRIFDIYSYEILVVSIINNKIDALSDWALVILSEWEEHIGILPDWQLKRDRERINNLRMAVLLLKGDYDTVFNKDNGFYKAIALLSRGEFETNLDKKATTLEEACTLLEALRESNALPYVLLNLIHGYFMLLNLFHKNKEEFSSIWTKLVDVIKEVDTKAQTWVDGQKIYLVKKLTEIHEITHGKDDEYIKRLEMRYQVKFDNESLTARSSTISTEKDANIQHWDIFIAHASADKAKAEKLYESLCQGAKVFLDTKCMRLGDEWDKAIPNAQTHSYMSIILVSEKTDEAYYQREEIATAIDMARHDAHRLIPVFLNDLNMRDLPYGLRIKQGIRAFESGDDWDEISNSILTELSTHINSIGASSN